MYFFYSLDINPFNVGVVGCCDADADGDIWILCSLSKLVSSNGLLGSWSLLVTPVRLSGFDLFSGELATRLNFEYLKNCYYYFTRTLHFMGIFQAFLKELD